jgi:hypothetical protein
MSEAIPGEDGCRTVGQKAIAVAVIEAECELGRGRNDGKAACQRNGWAGGKADLDLAGSVELNEVG